MCHFLKIDVSFVSEVFERRQLLAGECGGNQSGRELWRIAAIVCEWCCRHVLASAAYKRACESKHCSRLWTVHCTVCTVDYSVLAVYGQHGALNRICSGHSIHLRFVRACMCAAKK